VAFPSLDRPISLQLANHMTAEPLIAVFIDFENLALGVRDMKWGEFQIHLVLKRLLEKGRIVYKRAYCDWSHYRTAVREFHHQGVELIDIPQSKMSGKNSADIHMVVDALDLCYAKEHIDMFALISGDSDFSHLVSKLKENDKRVIGCGVKSSTSDLLIANCDEFIYYDDLVRASRAPKPAPKKAAAAAKAAASTATKSTGKESTASKEPATSNESDKKQEAIDNLLDIIQSLELDYDPLWGSMVKQAIRRVHPGFNEQYYGYRSFADFLEDVEKRGFIDLEYDEDRGNYKIELVED
jgi:uncharacterized protein (TIGR00288 family)